MGMKQYAEEKAPAGEAAPEMTAEQKIAQLEGLGLQLSAKRQKAIDARVAQGIDSRWFEDVEAYEGRDEVTRSYPGLRAIVQGYIESAEPQAKKRSTIVVNVTRQKVNTAAARRSDIALPTDDRNWDLRPSTVPELVEQMNQKHLGLTKNGAPIMVTDKGPDGQPQQRQATMADLAQMNMEEASKRAKAMRDEIDDQLDQSDNGCGWEGVLREAIFDCSLLGVGVVKGPVITKTAKKVWVPIPGSNVYKLSRIQDKKPVSMRVDPWDVYPHQDCGENAKKGAGIWERSRVTGGDIRHMADLPGYLLPQLQKVLREGPRKAGEKTTEKPGTQAVVDTETVFERWEYHGELDRDSLRAAGVELSEEDVFRNYSAVVEMINDTVVKADIELLDSEELPYDFYVVNKCSGSWAGYGESFLARSAQKAITAGWRSMMDNAGQIVGGQIVMRSKGLNPADGLWELSGMKVWFTDDEDVGKAFAVHEIPAHQQEYAAIIKMGMEFLDQETAIPMLAQGEQGEATDVLGGMNLLLNASNVVQRRALKALDDQVTIPHIGRYIDWNMQYNPKAEIKGDFEVQARASGALLEQAEQVKGLTALLNLASSPAWAAGMKKWDVLRLAVKLLRFPVADVVKTDSAIEQAEEDQAKNPPQDPRIAVEQLRTEVAKMRLQFEGQEGDKERNARIAIAMIQEKLQTLELSSVERQALERLKVELAQTTMKLNVQKDLSLADHLHTEHRERRQALTPPTEPKGRAKPGRSFQA